MFYSKIIGNAKQSLSKYESQNKATYAAAEQAIGGLLMVDGFLGTVNPLGGRRRNGIFGSLVGIILGVIFIFIPTFFNKVSGTAAMTATTSAKIVSVTSSPVTTTGTNGVRTTSNSCDAVAEYTVNGKQYSQQSSYGSSSYCGLAQGETVPINYNPASPGSWGYNVKEVNTIVGLFRWAGIVVVVLSFITFLIRLFSIIFGWKLFMKGRALAKTLPEGTNLETVIDEIKQSFSKDLFGFSRASANPPTPPAGPNQPAN